MDIWEAIKSDPEAGARRLVSECGNRLLAYAYALCHDRNAAEDLVFRTLRQVVEKISQFDPSKNFWNWLYAILLNYFRMDERKSRAEVGVEPVESSEKLELGTDCTLEELLAKSDAEILREAVWRLPLSIREAVMLRYFEDKTLEEMVGILMVPEGTVKWRLHRGRRLLCRLLTNVMTYEGGGQ